MTNGEARQYFKDCNLSYSDIDSGDICVLVMILNKTFKNFRKSTEISLRMSEKIRSKYKRNGNLIYCYLSVSGSYFTDFECISFYDDGLIGFLHLSGDESRKPIVDSFIQWCDYMKNKENNGK